jgi:hypothetical protein
MEVVDPAVYLIADPFATHSQALALAGDLRVTAQLGTLDQMFRVNRGTRQKPNPCS